MRLIRLATAAVSFVIGVVVVVWAGATYWVAVRGGAGDLSGAESAIFATAGLLVGLGLIYLARRVSPLGAAGASRRFGASDYCLVAGLILTLIVLLLGTPWPAVGFVAVLSLGCGLIAYGLIARAVRRIGR